MLRGMHVDLVVPSFAINLEITLVFQDRRETLTIRVEQERSIGQSVLLTDKGWEKRSRGAKAFEGVARLVSPLL